jgi:hypothetical protein
MEGYINVLEGSRPMLECPIGYMEGSRTMLECLVRYMDLTEGSRAKLGTRWGTLTSFRGPGLCWGAQSGT